MYKNFTRLKNVLISLQMLFHNRLSVDLWNEMSLFEKQIYRAILLRKFGKRINLEINIEDLREVLQKIITSPSHKWPEENYKFIFKKCLKYMKENIKDKLSLKKKNKKKDFEKQFYYYYFWEISERE